MNDDEEPTTFRYPESFKRKHVEEFIKSKLAVSEFMKDKPYATVTFLRWVRLYNTEPRPHIHPKYFSLESRLKIMEEYLKSNLPRETFGKIWGLSSATLVRWIRSYEKYGAKGLEVGKVHETRIHHEPKIRGRKKIAEKIEEIVISKKNLFPEFGLKKLHNNLRRFQAIKVSTGTIKRILKDENLYNPPDVQKTKRKPNQIRRFERATPMQLWQSDITSYLIGRENSRAYLVVFMDDNSRYIVAWSLSHKQTGEFVMQTLIDGITKFGKPHEVLTDQGRQYFSWRGRTEFQKLLIKQGIEHVVARSHHPQTLGKCERFWKTVGIEFWDRAKPKNINEAREKFAHFVNHYNHFRPHQGLEGMIPADRFFEVESEVKKTIEKSLAENELRLAVNETPKSPVFLFGQIGEQKISLHGESGKLVFQSQDGQKEEINYEEFGHGQSKNNGSENGNGGKYNLTNNSQKEEREEDDSDYAETSDRSSLSVDDGDDGAENSSERDGTSDYGLLDGETDEITDSEYTGSTDSENLADEPDGIIRNVCSDVSSTEGEENVGEQRRRSERIEEKNIGVGEDYFNSGSTDKHSTIDAGMSASRTEQNAQGRGEGKESEIAEEEFSEEYQQEERDEEWEQDSTTKSENKWGFSWWRKD